jgi:hypothetical protein
MIEIHLDAVASAINLAGGIVLAKDALSARRRTKVKRGGEKLIEGLQNIEATDETRHPDGNEVIEKEDKPDPDAIQAAEPGKIQDPEGYVIDSVKALEDWADRLTMEKARLGFILLVIGFGLDLFSKIFWNPLFLSI